MKSLWTMVMSLAFCATASAEECPWLEPEKAKSIERAGSRVELKWRLEPEWFRCAKKAGGKLVLRIFTGREGNLQLLRTRPITSYFIIVGVGHRDLCGQDPPDTQVQFDLTGKGEMERLTYRSEVVEVFCPRCTWRSYEHSLALRIGRRGKAVLVGSVGKEWHRCAKEGSTLSIVFYTGDEHAEVKSATDPVFVLRRLEKRARFKKKIRLRRLCKGKPRYVGFEYRGTGEMQTMNNQGRHIQELRCK